MGSGCLLINTTRFALAESTHYVHSAAPQSVSNLLTSDVPIVRMI